MPTFFSVGIFDKKLPFPALGSITKSHLSQSYFSPIIFRHFSAIDGIV